MYVRVLVYSYIYEIWLGKKTVCKDVKNIVRIIKYVCMYFVSVFCLVFFY